MKYDVCSSSFSHFRCTFVSILTRITKTINIMEQNEKEITIIIKADKEDDVRYALGRVRGVVGVKE